MMPPYRYLFDVRKTGRAPSPDALAVPPAFAPPAGYEIVPRPAARALAAYVANLRQAPYLFEAPPPPGAAGMTNSAPAGTNDLNPQTPNPNPQSTNAPAGGTNAAPAGTNAPNPQSTIRNPQSSQ
jgi:hypothetical protein